MYQKLSYPLREGEPSWPGNPSISLTPEAVLGQAGSPCNTCTIHLFNHFGTHFDAPRHFNPNGPMIAELPLERFLYHAPLLLDLPKASGEKLVPEDFSPYTAQIAECDLLLIRTGFWRVRKSDPKTYGENGPAMSSDAARCLMDGFPRLKSVALDFVSLACYGDPEDGNLAHRTMLGCFHDHFICIIEDVDMGSLPAGTLKNAAAIPLMVDGADSCPVTMWAEY